MCLTAHHRGGKPQGTLERGKEAMRKYIALAAVFALWIGAVAGCPKIAAMAESAGRIEEGAANGEGVLEKAVSRDRAESEESSFEDTSGLEKSVSEDTSEPEEAASGDGEGQKEAVSGDGGESEGEASPENPLGGEGEEAWGKDPQNQESGEEATENVSDIGEEGEGSSDGGEGGTTESLSEIGGEGLAEIDPGQEESGLASLQIPEKLEIVIDPWELDGKGQIYSRQFVIKNTGKTEGTLILSNLSCRPGKASGAVVKTDREGLHDNEEKSIYIEMEAGDGEKMALSQEASEYRTQLPPGGELPLSFSGEVNENASEAWQGGEIAVTVTYEWETGPEAGEEQEEEAEGEDSATEAVGETPEGSISSESGDAAGQ